MRKILTLWDIDGNLVNVYKYHTPAYQNAMQKVYGVMPQASDVEKNYGYPAREVVAIPIRKFGINETIIQQGIDRVLELYGAELQKGIESAKAKEYILPGVEDLLKKLKSLNIPMGIVTGNIRVAADAILYGSGLYIYFDPDLNSYADDVLDRGQIVLSSINAANRKGIKVLADDVFVFGDMPIDITAAKQNGCRSVAVVRNTVGKESALNGLNYLSRKEQLASLHPDHIFDDYTELNQIIKILK
jgi:phosphoglycolate phosphatase-like HAD superfamily hydrolase